MSNDEDQEGIDAVKKAGEQAWKIHQAKQQAEDNGKEPEK